MNQMEIFFYSGSRRLLKRATTTTTKFSQDFVNTSLVSNKLPCIQRLAIFEKGHFNISPMKRFYFTYYNTNSLNLIGPFRTLFFPNCLGKLSDNLLSAIECVRSCDQKPYLHIYNKKRRNMHKKRVQFPKEYFTLPTWMPFLCLLLQHDVM